MVAPFGTEPVPSRKKKFVADLRRTLNGSLKNFKSLRNKVRRNYEKSNSSSITIYFEFDTYLTFIIVEPSCFAMSFRWSHDALHSLSNFPMFAASSSKSIFEALVTAPIWAKFESLFTVWNNFKQYSKLNYQILNFASS